MVFIPAEIFYFSTFRQQKNILMKNYARPCLFHSNVKNSKGWWYSWSMHARAHALWLLIGRPAGLSRKHKSLDIYICKTFLNLKILSSIVDPDVIWICDWVIRAASRLVLATFQMHSSHLTGYWKTLFVYLLNHMNRASDHWWHFVDA